MSVKINASCFFFSVPKSKIIFKLKKSKLLNTMKKILLTYLCIILGIISFSQIRIEMVGSPTIDTSVNAYTGWTNQGLLTFQGNAAIKHFVPIVPNGGYVFFDTANTFLDISGFPYTYTDGIDVHFGIFASDSASSNDLKVELTFDGTNWFSLSYDSLIFPFLTGGRMSGVDTSLNITDMHLRFINTTTTKQFSIDNIMLNCYVLLPIKLEKFSSTIIDNNVVLSST